MPGTDLTLDPLEHDLVDTPAGDDWAADDTIASAIQHQLLDEKGRWFADPEAGNSAFTIPRKGNRATALRLESAHRDALRPFLELGLAEDLVLEFDLDQFGRLAWEGSMVDLQHGQLDLTPLLSYGLGEG
jgi:hypothetical protein